MTSALLDWLPGLRFLIPRARPPGALLFNDVLGDLTSRFGFAEVNALVLSNQTKDSPGLEVRHRCNGKQREWADQHRQNKPTDPSHTFVASRNGADKTNNYRQKQPKKKQHAQTLQSLPLR